MISAPEIAVSLQGAGRLARRDISGFAYLNATLSGFWRSFTAALLVYPAFLILVATRPGADRIGEPGFLVIETLAYVIGWFAFPLAMFHLTNMLGKSDRFLGYIVAINWCNVIQAWVIATVALVGAANVLPDALTSFLSAVAMLWALTFQWFVTRTGLAVNGFTAAGIVCLDVILSLFVMSVTQSVEGS